MKTILLAVLFCSSLCAQNLAIVVHDPTGKTADKPLSSTYQFGDTAANSASSVVLRISNPTSAPVQVVTVDLSNGTDFTKINPNFNITGLFVNKVLSPNSTNFEEFTVNFTPTAAGAFSGTLQATYLLGQSDGSFSNKGSTIEFGTLQGNGLPPTLLVSDNGANGSSILQPNSTSALDFGKVNLGSTSSVDIILSNQTADALTTPTIKLPPPGVFFSSAFTSTAATLPLSIPANSSVTFKVIFLPGQIGLTSATLYIGQNTYPLTGTGVVVVDSAESLQISYFDPVTGIRASPQAGTPIDFGQTAGTSASRTFSLANADPANFSAVAVPNISVMGAGFAIAGAPTSGAQVAKGDAASFQLVFSPSGPGTYSGTLSIGTRNFSLLAKGTSSAIPDATFQIDQSPLMSQQQVHLSIQLSKPAPIKLLPTLTMEFISSVSGISDDPAINFLVNSGRKLQMTFDSGSPTGIYSGQSALTFQTGTTAGTLKFTLAFADGTTATKSFTIAPAAVQITAAEALRQAPNLVLNLTGYDNTYSIGNLVFKFYDTAGKLMTPNGISVEAGSSFHDFFFNSNQAGGVFKLQAKFPVNGDVTTIGSVAVAIANSVAATNLKSDLK